MSQLDASVVLVGAVVVSAVAYALLRRSQRLGPRPARPESRLDGLMGDAPGLLAETDAALPEGRPAERCLVGRARTLRPGTRRVATVPAAEPGVAELLSLIGTMLWDRALALLVRLAASGRDLGSAAALAEAAVLERLRALPSPDLRADLGGYQVLAVLSPANPVYADRIVQGLAAIEARREALMAGLAHDEDRAEPGTVWLNHPWNPRFNDKRRPIWLYIGCRPDGRVALRFRTHWLGNSRIVVRGLDVVHDGISETLTRGAYRIDPDATGWEWRDEPPPRSPRRPERPRWGLALGPYGGARPLCMSDLARQREAVAHRLGHVRPAHPLRAVEVGDGARHPQDPVIAAC
jgi:hypothetical protein